MHSDNVLSLGFLHSRGVVTLVGVATISNLSRVASRLGDKIMRNAWLSGNFRAT